MNNKFFRVTLIGSNTPIEINIDHVESYFRDRSSQRNISSHVTFINLSSGKTIEVFEDLRNV